MAKKKAEGHLVLDGSIFEVEGVSEEKGNVTFKCLATGKYRKEGALVDKLLDGVEGLKAITDVTWICNSWITQKTPTDAVKPLGESFLGESPFQALLKALVHAGGK